MLVVAWVVAVANALAVLFDWRPPAGVVVGVAGGFVILWGVFVLRDRRRHAGGRAAERSDRRRTP